MSVSAKVRFTKDSNNHSGVTVTASRLKEAGFRVRPDALLKGERYKATLKDCFGNTETVMLTVNRSKANGSKQTTLYATPNTLRNAAVGRPVEYSVVELKKVRNRA